MNSQSEKKARLAQIRDLVARYVKDYGEVPWFLDKVKESPLEKLTMYKDEQVTASDGTFYFEKKQP